MVKRLSIFLIFSIATVQISVRPIKLQIFCILTIKKICNNNSPATPLQHNFLQVFKTQ